MESSAVWYGSKGYLIWRQPPWNRSEIWMSPGERQPRDKEISRRIRICSSPLLKVLFPAHKPSTARRVTSQCPIYHAHVYLQTVPTDAGLEIQDEDASA